MYTEDAEDDAKDKGAQGRLRILGRGAGNKLKNLSRYLGGGGGGSRLSRATGRPWWRYDILGHDAIFMPIAPGNTQNRGLGCPAANAPTPPPPSSAPLKAAPDGSPSGNFLLLG